MFGLSLIDWSVIVAYIVLITWVGLRSARGVSSTGDYFMGGRKFGKMFMIAQAFGSGTSTDQAVAVIGASSQVGLAGIWYQWLYMFSTPFFWLIAPIYRRTRYLTIGDYFEQRYGTGIGVVYSFVGLLYFAVNMAIVLKGTGITIEAMTGGAITTNSAILGMMAFFLIYGLLGGLVAAVKTQFIQGFFILILSFLLIPFALVQIGGIQGVSEALSPEMFSLIALEEVTLFFIIMAVLNALVGVVVQPHHMAINGAGKDEVSCRTGWTYGTFVKRFATLGWAFTGIFIAVLFPLIATVSVAEREMAFGLAIVELLPVGFIGLMFAALVAAVVAVCNSYMINGSALFTKNCYKRFIYTKGSQEHYMKTARISSFFVVITGVSIAIYIPSVVEGLLLVWKIMAFMGIAFWVAMFWRRANRWGAWASTILSAGLAFYTDSLGWSFAEQVALYLPVGFITMFVVSWITAPEEENRLNTFYSLLNTPVGEEDRLRENGIPIMNDSGSSDDENTTLENKNIPLLDNKVAHARGEGLLLTDLLKLGKEFNWRSYRVDLQGFGISWMIVAGYLILAMTLARIFI